jgi:hypothetical protein
MPKNTVTDLITDQEIAFARLILSGTMNDRRLSPAATHPAAPPVEPDIYTPEWLRKQQHQSGVEDPGDPVAPTNTQPAAPQGPHPEHAPEPTTEPAPKTANGSSFPNLDRNQTSPLNPFIKPEALNRVPAATGFAFDAVLDRANPIRLSFSPNRRFSGRRR